MLPYPDIAVLEDTQAFAALEEEWEDVYRSSARATPFQSWAWLYSWWESYGEDYELRLVTVRSEEGLLVGVVPLMLERRWGFGRLLFIGTGPTDYLDVLARGGWEEGVSDAARRALRQMGSWHVADLQELRPEAAAWGIFREWRGLRTRILQSNCPVLGAKPWEELLMPLSKNLRSTARRTLRRAEEDGVRRELVKPADVEQAARRLVALHREAWQGRSIASEHLSPKFEPFLKTAGRRMVARGLGRISEFWRGEEAIISLFWVFGRDSVEFYVLGASKEALRRYQVSSLYIWDGVNLALERDAPHLDLLRGEEPYKLRWTSKANPNYRVMLSGDPVFGSLCVAYLSLRAKAKRYVSLRAPLSGSRAP